MKCQLICLRGFLFCLLAFLIVACSQQSQTTKKQVEDKEASYPAQVDNEPQEPVVEEPVVEEPVVEEPVVEETVVEETVVEETVVEETVVEEPVVEETVVEEPVVEETVVEEPVVEETVVEEPVVEKPVSQYMTLSGQIQLDQDQLRRQNAQLDKTVIYFQPNNMSNHQLPQQTHTIITENKRFKPDVLAITRGSTVQFPVKDTILHNVFSVTPGTNFDLGLYSQGTTKEHVFNQSGIVFVHCNVHHAMQADVIVLDTPYFTYADSEGQYRLDNLPVTEGSLHFWHPRGQQITTEITTSSDQQNVDKMLVITRPKVPKHSNKFGESYRPTRD